mmetsp:Transcript_79052/g.229580  ORF Transcript_79052/g.229580 Transcript_79052/m.229580 type:complete len:121 (-) Transcript_79052:21-383(-)
MGWLPEGHRCDLCSKRVVAKGGVFCGRRRADASAAGCRAAVCWRCMNRAARESFGKVKTTKAEFASLGSDAWWMHEQCMSKADARDYYGNDEGESLDDDGAREKGDDGEQADEEARFAWE